MRPIWRLAAELSAASLLEMCPGLLFSDIWVGNLGFYLEYTSPSPFNDEFLRLVEERMREKIRGNTFCENFEMSTRNIISYLKQIKQHRLARNLDRREPTLSVIKIGEYVGVVENGTPSNLKEIGAIVLELRAGGIFGLAFPTKEECRQFQKALKEGRGSDHSVLGRTGGLFHIEGEELYWLFPGMALRKRVEEKIVNFLSTEGWQEVDFCGTMDWYGKQGIKKIFTTLEEEVESRFECGLKDYSYQKIFYIANSSLQMFSDFGKIIPLTFEFLPEEIVSVDFYGNSWQIVSQDESGVKIWIDRIVAMLVEKRELLV